MISREFSSDCVSI